MGMKVPPPHFMGFIPMALTSGVFFGLLWGTAMHFLLWGSQGWLFSASVSVAAGTLFGLCIAAYYRYSAKKLSLPSWERYPAAFYEPAEVKPLD
jgi:hypothetical protein